MSPREASECCGPLDELLDPGLFKAISDPTRARLLACLIRCGRACSVSEVAECCSVDFSVVSRHLRTLERAGVVESTRQGRTVTYAMQHTRLCAALRALADAIEECAPTQPPASTRHRRRAVR